MIRDGSEKVVFLTLIVERKRRDALLKALHESGVRLINTIYGEGTVSESYFLNTFGLVPEKKKTVITCLTTHTKLEVVEKMLVEQFHFNNPNAGIAFTIAVDKVSF